MSYYSNQSIRTEYWVRGEDDALVQRFHGDALEGARLTALNASGRVYEVVLDVTMEGTFIVSETEI